ncbi:Uncharacterised protein [Klebsiella pneumoniae]|nr:Uncharacterised protein [Klebsiella pneumoniae]SVN00726.1 Uncharacterised protein [Klebsiella pneumoniae]
MRIDGDCRPAEGGIQHHVCRFASHTGKRLKGRPIFRHFAIVLFKQDPAGLDNVFGFTVKQADGFDIRLHSLNAQRQHGRWRIGDRIEFCRSFVDADVGGLR